MKGGMFMIGTDAVFIFVSIYALFVLCAYKIGAQTPRKPKSALKIGKRNKICGVTFGRANWRGNKVYYSPLRDTEYSHCAVFGKSGTGKSTAILSNLLLSIGRAADKQDNPLASSFNIDISGELSKLPIKNKIVYDALNHNSPPYNIWAPIDELETEEQKIEALNELALLLMPAPTGTESEASRYYLNGGRSILTACLIYGYFKKMEFCDICKFLASNSYKNLFPVLQETNNEQIFVHINAFHGNSEANISGCYDCAVKAIKLYATTASLAQNIRRPRKDEVAFSPHLLESGTNIFIVIPDYELERFANLLSIITAQTLSFCAKRAHAAHPKKQLFKQQPYKKPQPTIFFNLDEYPTLQIDILPALRLYRKLNIRIFLFCQSYHDLLNMWGEQYALSMLSNCAYWVVLSADTPQAQKFFCEKIGYKPTKKRSISRSSKSKTYTESEEKEYAIAPEELGRLDKKLIVITPHEHKLLRKSYYFE